MRKLLVRLWELFWSPGVPEATGAAILLAAAIAILTICGRQVPRRP